VKHTGVSDWPSPALEKLTPDGSSALVSENPGDRGSLDRGPAAIIPVCELLRNVRTYRGNRAGVMAGPSLAASIPAEPWWCQVIRLCQGSSLELSLPCPPSPPQSAFPAAVPVPWRQHRFSCSPDRCSADGLGQASPLCTTGPFPVPARRAKSSFSQHIDRSGLSGGSGFGLAPALPGSLSSAGAPALSSRCSCAGRS